MATKRDKVSRRRVNTGGVYAQRPEYQDRAEEWQLMRDAIRGESAIKAEGTAYLPMPAAFTIQSDKGVDAYNAYRARAQFPEITAPTVSGMVGVIHRTEAQIDMPEAMEPLWERATKYGLSLEAFHRRITSELLSTGRYAVLVDADPLTQGGSTIPYLAGYTAEALLNWSDDADFFVLDESRWERDGDGFEWTFREHARVLILEGGVYKQKLYDGQNVVEEIIPTRVADPNGMPVIPFSVAGTTDLDTTPDDPPLLGVARAAKAIYQLSADYRHQLFSTGQETLFIYGADAPEIVGAGVVVSLKADGGPEAPHPSAAYVGPTGTGIAAHKTAIEDEKNAASQAGARLFNSGEQGVESGEAKRIRYASEMATLTTISQASAGVLERSLKNMATMMGLNPDEVVVKPNLKFVDTALKPTDAVQLVKLWQDEAISYETLYDNLQRGEIASAERTFEEEQALIDKELEDADKRQEEMRQKGLLPPIQAPGSVPPTPGNTPPIEEEVEA